MPRVKAYEAGLHELRWLTKPQAMTYTNRLTEEVFEKEIAVKVNRYRGGKGFLYDKRQLDRVIEG